jgi:hypothetical protein
MKASGYRFFVGLFIFAIHCLTAQAQTPAQPINELITKLQTAIKEEVNKTKSATTTETEASRYRTSMWGGDGGQWISQVKTAIARGDQNSLRQVLTQIQAIFSSDEIARICTSLVDAVDKDITERNKKYLDDVDAAVEKAIKNCLAAKEPKELDSFIIELTRLSQQTSDYGGSEVVSKSSSKARSAVTFLCRWQDYLAQKKSGNDSAAVNILKNLSQDTSSYPFVSRSEILDRIRIADGSSPTPVQDGGSAPKQPESASLPSLKDKTLKDLPALKNEIDQAIAKMGPNYNTSGPFYRFSQQLDEIMSAQTKVRYGLVGSVFSFCKNATYYGSSGASEEWLPLKQELLLMLLPSYLGLSSNYQPKAGELSADFLLRITKEARDKEDWFVVWKALETYQSVAFNAAEVPGWLRADVVGTSLYLVGLNQEKAGLYLDAYRSYKASLAQPGQNLPLKQATERMNALLKDHEKEWGDALKVNPVTTEPTTFNGKPFGPVPTR